MQLEVVRFSSEEDSTNGLLFDITDGQRKFLSYTLEDEYREEKIMAETRVPAGTYSITLRTEGGFNQRYDERFGTDFNKGMLWVRDVPGFEYILIHTGNTDEHTMGCLLVNDGLDGANFVGNSSVNAYKRIYPIIAKALLDGEKVTITYEK